MTETSKKPPPPPKKQDASDGSPGGEFVRVTTRYLRQVGQDLPEPDTVDDGGTWTLDFAPSDGAELKVRTGERVWVETGLVIAVPKGYVARVSHRAYNGRPGLWVPALEVDADAAAGVELIVPVRNETSQTLVLHPGEPFFRLQVTEPVRAFLLPSED